MRHFRARPGSTRQSIIFAKFLAKKMDHPNSGLPEFGHLCAQVGAPRVTAVDVLQSTERRRSVLSPARSPAAAHAGAAGGRARAGPVRLGFFGRARPHFVEGGFARAVTLSPHARSG